MLSFLLGGATTLYSQAIPAASRAGDVQIGVGYSMGNPDYVQTYQGLAVYADFDFTLHLGVEAEFHQIDSTSSVRAWQRTYEIGGRYFRTYGPVVPYVKGMYGRGDFLYPYGLTELGYNMFAGGAGADIKLGPYIHLRGEYEFQKWTSFPNGGLTPRIVTLGVAYHFPSSKRTR